MLDQTILNTLKINLANAYIFIYMPSIFSRITRIIRITDSVSENLDIKIDSMLNTLSLDYEKQTLS